jgi:hypothetical protein
MTAEAPDGEDGQMAEETKPGGLKPSSADNWISLLTVYATQFGSYTTLLWQVPALGLTAQSFLMTIALTHDSSRWARLIASVLGMIVVGASYALMHDQRGRAINQGALACIASNKLSLKNLIGNIGPPGVTDGVPKETDAEKVWTDRKTSPLLSAELMYHIWRLCLALFAIADVLIIVSASLNLNWFNK